MRSFATAAALGLAASSVVSAAPAKGPKNNQFPFKEDGFPNPNARQLDGIEDRAFGTLSNAKPPPKLNADTITSLQLVNFGEQIEAKFFKDLLSNITKGGDGFDRIANKDFTVKALKSMQATEELHTINAIKALAAFHHDQIEPCEYKFPVSDFPGAISFISTTTDFVQGVLGDVIEHAAAAGDAGFTQGVAGALSNEGEQDGFFRFLLGQNPNQKPFNTIGKRDYAFSKLQDLVVPNSCPNADEINLKVFQPLDVQKGGAVSAKTQDLHFTIPIKPTRADPHTSEVKSFVAKENTFQKYEKTWRKDLAITYLSGQDLPITKPLKKFQKKGNVIEIVAEFPFDDFKMFGLSVAALTKNEVFATSDDMVKGTINAPAFIEVAEKI